MGFFQVYCAPLYCTTETRTKLNLARQKKYKQDVSTVVKQRLRKEVRQAQNILSNTKKGKVEEVAVEFRYN